MLVIFSKPVLRGLLIVAAPLALVSCCTIVGGTMDADQRVDADVIVTITEDKANPGKFVFEYNNVDFSDRKGNLNFTGKKAKGKTVVIDFLIGEGSVPGIKFQSPGKEAIYIIEKNRLSDPNASPAAPYAGTQFTGFATMDLGRRAHVVDLNDDGELYRYSLRFTLDGQPVVDDPDAQNGTKDF